MGAAKKLERVSVEEYLEAELKSPVKHEYLGGAVFAMAGALNAHNRIASNTLISLGSRLRGKRCQAFNSDTKVRIQLPSQILFYYPEVTVTCRPNPDSDSFQDEPAVVVEVLSRGTRRIDEGEKKHAYLSIPSLRVYLLIETETPAVVAYRRTVQGFVREVYEGMNAVVPLDEIETDLPLAEVYKRVEFRPEPGDDE